MDHDKADLDRMKADYDRAEAAFQREAWPKQDFELKKFTYDAPVGRRRSKSEARVCAGQGPARADRPPTLASTQRRIAQAQANLARFNDVLHKHDSYRPARWRGHEPAGARGRNRGARAFRIRRQPIMTIADMSLITAEVKVDETDIVNVQLGQTADITIDAIPNKTFKGHVTEIGNTAILRSTGVAASQSAISSQEAKDFKVVIAMDNPPDEIRPGLSCTAKITTATRQNVLTIPIQALTVRQKGDLEPKPQDRDRRAGGHQARSGGRKGPQGRDCRASL